MIEKVQAFEITKFDFAKIAFHAAKDNPSNPIGEVASWAIDTILIVAGALAIIYFIYSGILYLTSAGNPDNIKKAQQGLIYAAIGIAVIVISNYILTAIADFVRIK